MYLLILLDLSKPPMEWKGESNFGQIFNILNFQITKINYGQVKSKQRVNLIQDGIIKCLWVF